MASTDQGLTSSALWDCRVPRCPVCGFSTMNDKLALAENCHARGNCGCSVRCTIQPDILSHVWYIYFAKRRGLIAEKEVSCHYRKRCEIKAKGANAYENSGMRTRKASLCQGH